MDFKAIYSVVTNDFDAADRFILEHLNSSVPLVREVGEYIINSGGKRLRPLVSILSARACGYSGQQHIDVAAIIEFLHTATLLHDDVVDESNMRRGRPTVNAVWGNAASVLVGDFLISRAFQLVVSIGNPHLLEILANSTNIISEGEVLQLLNCHDPNTDEERYMRVIHHKTAKMFESAAETGAVLGDAGDNLSLRNAMAAYGRHLGIAFQLIDDVLDYVGNADELGKNVGDDLAEGKPTLPLIYTIREGCTQDATMIRNAIRTGGLDNLQTIVTTVKQSGGLEYTLEKAKKQTELAIQCLAATPDSEYKAALIRLAEEAVNRHF